MKRDLLLCALVIGLLWGLYWSEKHPCFISCRVVEVSF